MNIVAAVMVPVVDAGHVVEGLEGRTGLSPAVGQDVELRLELLGRLGRVVVGRADVGHDLAGLPVHGDQRSVVDLLVAELGHPRLVGDAQLLGVGLGVLDVGQDGRRLDPPLAELLELPVERGHDLEPAALEDRAGLGAGIAEQVGELLAHRPDEVGRLPDGDDARREDDWLGPGGVEVGRRVADARVRR